MTRSPRDCDVTRNRRKTAKQVMSSDKLVMTVDGKLIQVRRITKSGKIQIGRGRNKVFADPDQFLRLS